MNTPQQTIRMHSHAFLAALQFCLFVWICSILSSQAAQPNILLILSDDHSAPHLGCYSNSDLHTPRLDQLAKDGMIFTRAYTTAPQCVPSRASILTGRSPVAIDMTRFSAPLPKEVVTLPDLLRERGYYTGLMGRTHHLDGTPQPGPIGAAYKDLGLATMSQRVDVINEDKDRTKAPAYLNEFLDKAGDKPWFLQFCFFDPHRPNDAGDHPSPESLTLPGHYPDLPITRGMLGRYYKAIERLDGDVGSLLDILKERGLDSNTLVVFMGDNGAAQLRGKGTLYEFGINVPLVMRWPGVIKPGTKSKELISGEDITPTLLAATGTKIPDSMTGFSFLPLLEGKSFRGRTELFSERGSHASTLPTNTGAFDLSRCIVTPTHKLIYNALPKLSYLPVDFGYEAEWYEVMAANQRELLSPEQKAAYFPPERPMFELYDLTKDPYELNNLAGKKEFADLELELREKLAVWMLKERDYLPLPHPKYKKPSH
jgi:arylsulfatase A-like enzyme